MYEVNKSNIWNFRQNNPELIIEDAKKYLGLNQEQCEGLRTILMARGVNKWFKVRRDLIAYKKQIKHQIKDIECRRIKMKVLVPGAYSKRAMLKEVSKTLQRVRGDLKKMCMTDRWQVWPVGRHHHESLKSMNSIKAKD